MCRQRHPHSSKAPKRVSSQHRETWLRRRRGRLVYSVRLPLVHRPQGVRNLSRAVGAVDPVVRVVDVGGKEGDLMTDTVIFVFGCLVTWVAGGVTGMLLFAAVDDAPSWPGGGAWLTRSRGVQTSPGPRRGGEDERILAVDQRGAEVDAARELSLLPSTGAAASLNDRSSRRPLVSLSCPAPSIGVSVFQGAVVAFRR